MSDHRDLHQARASAAADGNRRGLLSSGGSSSDNESTNGAASGPSLAVRTRDLLRRYDLRPRKALGQNFLINPKQVERLAASTAEAAARTGVETVVEIGPGLGALTTALADRQLPVVAFEIDRALQAPLEELLAGYPRSEVRWLDFLQVDLAAELGGRAYVAAGNLPYQITAPLLEKLLQDPLCRALVITVQREVADRLRAAPGSRTYGPLTLFRAYHAAEAEVITQLHPGDFLPPPQVDSTALRLLKRTVPPFTEPSAEAFERAVRGAFNHRRKSLRSGLALAPRLGLDRSQVEDALDRAEVSGDRRAETLDMAEFARLALALDEVREGA
jgi:16S rRNA (adenine1518-N6/adenine1519-N6)-dimethyltransferase